MRRLLAVVLFAPVVCWGQPPSDDGFIWIDANTRIKVTPTAAGAGSTTPQKPPEEPKKDKKDPRKK